jgi:cobalt-zinc-cadmium efflux system protein
MNGQLNGPRGRNRRRLTLVLALTSVYLVAEVIGGLLTHSLALLADAGHMLADVAGLALALVAMRFGERPATPERTYGFYRVEILAALANAVVLIGISVLVLVEAVERFRNPPPVASLPMLVVAAIGLVVNVAGVVILRGGSAGSLNMKGAYFEVLSDALTSVGVIAAGVVMLTTGWYYADPILSAAIGLFILPRTWKLLSEAVGILLEGTPSNVNLAALRESLLGLPGVSDVHDLHVWTLTSGVNAMSAHIVKSGEATEADLVPNVCGHVIKTFKIAHCTIQAETDKCGEWESHL